MTQDVFLVVALGLLIFMMVWSNRKRKKQAESLQSNLQVGKTVMLHSGVLGNIVSIDDKNVIIETTKDVKLTVVKAAIRGIEETPLVFATAKSPVTKSGSRAVAKAVKPAGESASKSASKPSAKKASK